MRNYILVMLITLIALIGNSILLRHSPIFAFDLDVRFHEVVVAGTMAMGALFATTTRSRLGAVVSVGVMGGSRDDGHFDLLIDYDCVEYSAV